MIADVFNFFRSIERTSMDPDIQESRDPKNPENRVKKSLAGCSLFFFRLVIVTSISRLLDTVCDFASAKRSR